MSEQTDATTTKETAKDRKAREAAEAAAGTDGATPTQDGATANGEATATKTRSKAPDVSTVTLDAINGATLAPQELVVAAAPMRERNDQQKAMDAVAVKAYEAWIKAGRPSIWAKVPVVTYFLEEADVPKYKYLIRRACAIVEPAEGSPGVRVRFGNEFTLSEQMANRPEINRPDDAGKIVLAWAAVDKRNVEDRDKSDS